MSVPTQINRSSALVDEVMITDRNGKEIAPMGDALVYIDPDWDIDRAGSKGHVEIEAHQGVLHTNMWIAPYRTIIPEVGDIVRYPRGHFKLGRPGVTYDGTLAMDTGIPAEHQSASGSDIIDDIAAVKLQETFVTPTDTIVMEDVRALIKLATAGLVGHNLVTNSGFTTDIGSWVPVVANGASGVARHNSNYGGSLECYFNASSPTNGIVQAYQQFSIPAGTRYVVISGLSRTAYTANIRPRLYIDFRSDSAVINAVIAEPRVRTNSWARTFEVFAVPDGTTTIRVTAQAITISGASFSSNMYWDDINVQTATVVPLPDSRIQLPPTDAVATALIQTTVTNSIGYDAINGDRLAAIGHHALYTTLEGKVTTSPLRNLAMATPKRTYGPGDLRITSPVEVPAIKTNIPNHFPAIKESFEVGVSPLYAEAWNENPNDPNSVVNTGQVISDEAIRVPDAVSQAALQAVADAARDRHATQEQVGFNILPDPTLTVYDVIAITDPAMPDAVGKWSIEYIGHDGPEMVISARRAIGGGS